MTIYRDTDRAETEEGYPHKVGCDTSDCRAELSVIIPRLGQGRGGELDATLAENGWGRQKSKAKTKGADTKYHCPKHLILSPEESDRRKLDGFIETRISIDEHDAVPTTRVWDEFVRYVGSEHVNDPAFTLGKRDVYAAVRALGDPVEDGLLNLVIDGKQTSTPTFKGISLKTTAEPEDHAEWFAKRKGGVLAKKREIKAANLEYHRGRADRRRAAARKPATPHELVRRFAQDHVVPNPEGKMTTTKVFEVFRRFLAKEGAANEVGKREMMSLLAGHGLKARRTSVRPKGGKPKSLMVYDGIGIIGMSDLPTAPVGPPEALLCAVQGCPEAAPNWLAGDLGWRRVDDEVFCLGHAEHHGADPIEIIAATWPQRDLDRPGPRGREVAVRPRGAADDDVVLDEDLPAPGQPDNLEAILAAMDAIPEDAEIIPDSELIYDEDL